MCYSFWHSRQAVVDCGIPLLVIDIYTPFINSNELFLHHGEPLNKWNLARELERDARTCLSWQLTCSWVLQKSRVCEFLWLKPAFLMWPQHRSWPWQPWQVKSSAPPSHTWWYFLRMCVFSRQAHAINSWLHFIYLMVVITARCTEGQLWGTRGPQSPVVTSVKMGQW